MKDYHKGETYEEIYGTKRATEIKEKLSILGKRPNSGQFKKGQISIMEGKHHTEASLEKMRKGTLKWQQDPANQGKMKRLREKQSKSLRKHLQELKDTGKYEEVMKKRGKKISKAKKGVPLTEAHKKALTETHFSRREGYSESFVKKSNTLKRRYRSGEIQPWNKGLTKETDERVANAIFSQPHSDEWNKNVAIGHRKSKKWQEYIHSESHRRICIERLVAARIANENIRPNKPESRFIELCKKYSLPYKYVGDGQFWLGYPPKNPDFLNTNGVKQVVEIDGVYWHFERHQKINPNLTREEVEDREKAHYSKYSFDCVIVWEDDSDEQILNKVGYEV